CLELGDVVDPVSARCSPFLQMNTMVPRPSISTTEPSPNRTLPHTLESSSAKAWRQPVMWFVAQCPGPRGDRLPPPWAPDPRGPSARRRRRRALTAAVVESEHLGA